MGSGVSVRLHRLLSTVAITLYLIASCATAADGALATTDDWSREASMAGRAGTPILVVFTRPDCGYCKLLKEQVLLPLQEAQIDVGPRVIIREFSTDTGGKIGDFDGERVRARVFLHRFDVFAIPTVVLLDPRGRALGSPIVGYNSADAYTPRLQEAIATARKSLHRHYDERTVAKF